jgi:hypothetical protein
MCCFFFFLFSFFFFFFFFFFFILTNIGGLASGIYYLYILVFFFFYQVLVRGDDVTVLRYGRSELLTSDHRPIAMICKVVVRVRDPEALDTVRDQVVVGWPKGCGMWVASEARIVSEGGLMSKADGPLAAALAVAENPVVPPGTAPVGGGDDDDDENDDFETPTTAPSPVPGDHGAAGALVANLLDLSLEMPQGDQQQQQQQQTQAQAPQGGPMPTVDLLGFGGADLGGGPNAPAATPTAAKELPPIPVAVRKDAPADPGPNLIDF